MAKKYLIVARSMATVSCVLVAGYLAFNGKDGWGWFLFVGLLVADV